MTTEFPGRTQRSSGPFLRLCGYAVHVYTALGACCGLLAAIAIMRQENGLAFVWLTSAVLIDATDGILARKLRVKTVLPHMDGAKLDDIVDYLNYTFLPMLMIFSSNWLPPPAELWACFPLIASLFAFIHCDAKESGFFRGFPSYWNVVAFYIAIWLHRYDAWIALLLVLALSALSVMPIRFVYPNRSERYPRLFVGGAIGWLAVNAVILFGYDLAPPNWLIAVSLVYPAFYFVMSVYLHRAARRRTEGSR